MYYNQLYIFDYDSGGHSMSEKTITIREFADEMTRRLNKGQTIDCCKDELLNLAVIIKQKIGDEKIKVHWKD